MINQLDNTLRRLLTGFGATAAVIWSVQNEPPAGTVVSTWPHDLLPTGAEWPVTITEAPGVLEQEPTRLAAVVPTTLRIELPGPPTAAQVFKLGDGNLYLLVVWCHGAPATEVDANLQNLVDNELSYLGHLTEDNHFIRREIARLRRVVDGLDEAVVSVDAILGHASVNESAAQLLHLLPGKVPATDFAAAMARLAEHSLNRPEIAESHLRLQTDPTSQIDQVWRFAENPTHLRVVSTPAQDEEFEGRVWVFTDESALSQALESAEDALNLARATSDAMLDPLVQLSAIRDIGGDIVDFRYVDVNRAGCEYLQLGRQELIGQAITERLPSVRPSGLLDHYVHCLETGEPLVLNDFRVYNGVRDEEFRCDIRAAASGPDSITLTWRDVTERFAAAQQIAESEEQFRLLAENSGDMVVRIRHGRFVWISPAVETVLGATADHWLGRRIADVIPELNLAEHVERQKAIDSGKTTLARLQIVGYGGVRHWVHLNAKPFYDASGTPDGAVAALRLIDAEVAAEQQAYAARELQAQADARYRRLMDGSPVSMCLVSPDGRFEQVNQAVCEFFGYDAETLQTKAWQEITAPEFLAVDQQLVDNVLAGRIESYRLTMQYIHADGHLIWGDLSVSALRDAEGNVENFVSQIVDVTAERSLSDRLTAELASAKRYIASLLPGELDGEVHVSSIHLPSTELAGDCYDYHWIDDDHLIVYLLDVSGHGIAPALVSISVHNMLRCASLPRETMLIPDQTLAALNTRFQMDRQGGHYFTIWYGVYEKSTRTLSYSSAGQPPALLYTIGAECPVMLATDGLPVGMFDDGDFFTESVVVQPGSRILLYSDGTFEWKLADGRSASLPDFIELCTDHAQDPDWSLGPLLDMLIAKTPGGAFDDDCSLVRLEFD